MQTDITLIVEGENGSFGILFWNPVDILGPFEFGSAPPYRHAVRHKSNVLESSL